MKIFGKSPILFLSAWTFICLLVALALILRQSPLIYYRKLQVGRFEFPELSKVWAKEVYDTDVLRGVKLSRKIGVDTSLIVSFIQWKPYNGIELTIQDIRENIRNDLIEQILSVSVKEVHFRGWPSVMVEKKFVPISYYYNDDNMTLVRTDEETIVTQKKMTIFRPPGRYELIVSLRGEDQSGQNQAELEMAWNYFIQHLTPTSDK